MANCVLCWRPNPSKLHRGLCSTCYQEYRAMMSLEEEPYRLAKRGGPQSLDLLGFLLFLKQRETDAYIPIWQVYACLRRLVVITAASRRSPSVAVGKRHLPLANGDQSFCGRC